MVFLCGCTLKVTYTAEDVTDDPERLLVNKNFIIGEKINKAVGDRLVYRKDIINMAGHLVKDMPGNNIYSGNKKVLVNTFTPKSSFGLKTYNGTIRFSNDKKYFSVYKHENLNLIQTHFDVGKRRWMLYLPVDKYGVVQGESFYSSKKLVYPKLALANEQSKLKSHRNFDFDNDHKYEFVSLGKTIEPIDDREQVYYFEQEIIYTGKTKNIINLVYREYYTHAIKPGMSVELHYDLAESNIINYKGYSIEVIESTNHAIEYRVLSD